MRHEAEECINLLSLFILYRIESSQKMIAEFMSFISMLSIISGQSNRGKSILHFD